MTVWTPNPDFYDIGRPFPANEVVSLFSSSKLLNETIPTDVNAKVYEPGCGTGRILLPLAQNFPSWEFFGGEISPQVLEVCNGRLAAAKITNVATTQSDVREPILETSFDLILHSSVLHAVSDWKVGVRALASSLKDSGLFVLVGDYGDLYDEALGRSVASECDETLSLFWSLYREARDLVGAPNAESSQVGAHWDLESTEIASALTELGFNESERTTASWLQTFTIEDLLEIVTERCYSSMFTVDPVTYQNLIVRLKETVKAVSVRKMAVSRHQAVARFFHRQ